MESKTKLWYLENFNLFKPLSMDDLMELNDKTDMEERKNHEIIYFPEDNSNTIYFLKEGRIKLSRTDAEGRQITLAILGPGEIFGEMSMFGESSRTEYAEALEKVKICAVSKSNFEEFLKKHSTVMLSLVQWVGFRRRQIEEMIESLVFKSAPQRVASFLNRYQAQYGKDKYWGREVKPFLSHQELAYITATSRQTVTTLLNEMKQDGIIELKKKTLVIKDLPQLKTMADI